MEIAHASDADAVEVRALFWEYLQWANTMVEQTYGVSFDIADMLEGDMAGIHKFYPPRGRLLLARQAGAVAGCACMQRLHPEIAELKRTFVRPAYRGMGAGRALVQTLIDELCAEGYSILRLDSAIFMREAHALYRSLDFQEREPYSETEIPAVFHDNWVFMERQLRC